MQPARVDALDGVRGLAILPVVAMHSLFFGVPLPGAPFAPEHPYVRIASLGWCGVDVFFVLSGFLITGILLRSKEAPHYFRDFYARRALRIFPLHYVVITLLLFVLPRPPAAPGDKFAYLAYVQNFVLAFGGDSPGDVARHITWSLAIEEQFYLVWPAVVFFASRRTLVRVAIAAIVAAVALRFVLLEAGVGRPYFLTFCRMDALAAGALLALLPSPGAWFGRCALLAGAAGLAAVAAITGALLPHTDAMQTWGLLAALSLAVGLLVLARHGGVTARLCTNRVLRSFGRYSYCIYLVHLLVIEALAHASFAWLPSGAQQWLVASVPIAALMVVFTATCMAASWVAGCASWHVFEKHFLALKRHFPGGATRQ